MDRRKALVVAGAPLDGGGGVETVCRSIMQVLNDQGFASTYISGVQLVERRGIQRRWGYRVWGSAAEAFMVGREARSESWPDLVVTNGSLGYGIRGKVSIHYYHGTYVEQAQAIKRRIRRRGFLKLKYFDGMVLESLAGRGKICLANSPKTAREVLRYFGHKCKVIWCPVDTEGFCPGPRDRSLLSTLGIRADRPVGLFVGPDQPVKGAETAREIIRQLPGITWLVLGRSPRALTALPSVVAKDRVVPDMMPSILRSVDFVLITSLYESFSLLLAEAFACGTPVIAGPTGAGELFGDLSLVNRYFVADAMDIAAFIAAIRSLLADLPAARSAALEGRQRVLTTLHRDVWARRFLSTVPSYTS